MKKTTLHPLSPCVAAMREERPDGKLAEILRSFRERTIPFHGPFQSPKGNRVFVVMDCIITESELIQLYDADKLTVQNIKMLKT